VGNAFRQGFYWFTAVADASEIVRTCEGCQFYTRKTNLLAQALQMILVTWPFAVWGLDIVGPLQKARECKFHRINKVKGRLDFPLKTKSVGVLDRQPTKGSTRGR
jgi:hypothetical protein